MLALCAQLDALERRYQQTCGSATTIEQDKANEPVLEAIRQQQQPILAQICAMTFTTPEGAAAVAASFVLWDGELYYEEDCPHDHTGNRLLAALLRGTLGRA